ncbi:MAG: hypothetical protein HC866_20160 [Leptolyngbyaceae cyanobacterium RU_5_1]|nr:hypothetical protein [Leptolyngbyaceae cyanobacterium RU_5_1]
MATATRKRPKATAVNHQLVGQASALLQELPEKQKEDLSLREAISQMQEPLRAALAKGYNYADLAAMLSEQGIKISPLTLKNYVPSGKRQATKTKAKRVKKSVSEEAAPSQSSPEVTAPDASTETPAPTPAKRGRAKSAGTAKPAAKTKPESKTSERTPTRTQKTTAAASKTKSVTKAPATRGRKKLS